MSSRGADAVKDPLDGCSWPSGTLRFTPGRPLPDEAVRALVRHRRDESLAPAR
ncbi:MAG TPA: hypothetical protein VGD03_00680 [Frankiaceae bacterium]